MILTPRPAASRGRLGHPLRTALILLTPFLIGLAVFSGYPLVSTIYYSFTDFRAGSYRPVNLVGLRNYQLLFTSSETFWIGVGNTLWMVLVMVPLRTVFALFVAWAVNRVKRGAGTYRTLFYLPSMVPVVAAALSFIVLMNPAGVVNAGLAGIGIAGPGWFSDPDWSKPSLVVMALWACGNTMVIFSAAMLDVPRDLYDAAALDGAGTVRQFWHVTLPTLRPVLLFSVLTSVIYTFQYFTEAFVASGSANGLNSANQSLGYPLQSLLFYSTDLYAQGFVYFKTGYASAMAVILFLVVLVATIFFVRAFRGEPGGAQ